MLGSKAPCTEIQKAEIQKEPFLNFKLHIWPVPMLAHGSYKAKVNAEQDFLSLYANAWKSGSSLQWNIHATPSDHQECQVNQAVLLTALVKGS